MATQRPRPTVTDTDPKGDSPENPRVDPATHEVQKLAEEASERGLVGDEVDPTPNEHYTVAGVVAGKPVPETDPDARAEAQAAHSPGR